MMIRRGNEGQIEGRASYLVTDDRLLDSSEVLEGRQQNMTPLRTANILDKAAKFLTQGNENLIFILHGLCTELWLGEVFV